MASPERERKGRLDIFNLPGRGRLALAGGMGGDGGSYRPEPVSRRDNVVKLDDFRRRKGTKQ